MQKLLLLNCLPGAGVELRLLHRHHHLHHLLALADGVPRGRVRVGLRSCHRLGVGRALLLRVGYPASSAALLGWVRGRLGGHAAGAATLGWVD